MRNLIKFLSRYKGRIAIMLLLLFIQVVGTLYIPTLTADIVNNGIAAGDLDYVWKTGRLMLIVALSTAVFSICGTFTSTYISTALGRDIRGAIFHKVQDFSISDFSRFGAASLITRSTSDVSQIQMAFSATVEILLPAPFMAVAGLVLVFSKDALLASMIIFAMMIILVIAVFVAKKVIPLFEQMQTSLDGINRTVREGITGVRVIRAFNREKDSKRRMDRSFENYAATAIKANKIFAGLMPVIMLIMNILTILFVWFGGKQVAAGRMEIGDIMAVIEYSMLTLFYLIMSAAAFIFIPRIQTSAKRINAVLLTAPEFAGAQKALNHRCAKDAAKIEFKDVTFRYAAAKEAVLQNISFSVKRGSTTAIIGSTGSGKSTIANLIMRFYDTESGSVFVDGTDVRAYDPTELRKKIGYVPQKAFLFSGTIADNLRHGKKDATEQEMQRACKIAQLDGLIASSEDGLLRRVSQAGNNFSGGQKQRLSIARAVIRKPDIYIFDDSFSALDFKTDAKLRAALKNEVGDSAVLIIAQRISTILDADQIVVLNDGRIAGIGTHRQLLASCPVYQQIARSQMSEEELA